MMPKSQVPPPTLFVKPSLWENAGGGDWTSAGDANKPIKKVVIEGLGDGHKQGPGNGGDECGVA